MLKEEFHARINPNYTAKLVAPETMNIRKSVILVILLIAGGVLTFNYLSGLKEEPEKKVPPAVVRSVLVKPATYTAVETAVTAYGRVANGAPVQLVAEVGGKLIGGAVPLKEAQGFLKGQLLYKIDDTEARLALQSQKSELLNALGLVLADLKTDYPDAFPIWKSWFEQIDLNKPLPELPAFRSMPEKNFFSTRRILTLYYTIQSAEERLSRYSYTAPYSGSFAEVATEAGSIVTPGTRIGRIIRTDYLEAVLPVPVSDLQWVNRGARLVLHSNDRKYSWTGTVVRISDAVDPATQSVNLYVAIQPLAGQTLYEGMYLHADVQGKAVRQALTLPREAIVQTDKVYVVVDGKLELRTVSLLRMDDETALIQGLPEGVSVVVEALANVTEGMTVNPRTAS